MTEYLSCAETAKLIRAALKKAFPGIKFSVRSSVYSGGASINVRWTDGPAEKAMTDLRIIVLAELADRYTGLADNYRMYVQSANNKTLRRVLDLARVDAAGSEIMSALGAVELDEG